LFSWRGLPEALDMDGAAFAVGEHVSVHRSPRFLPRLFAIAARAAEFAPQLFLRPFIRTRAPGMTW
jgi:hypothetical protein